MEISEQVEDQCGGGGRCGASMTLRVRKPETNQGLLRQPSSCCARKGGGEAVVEGLGGLPADGRAGCQDQSPRLRASLLTRRDQLRTARLDGCAQSRCN